MAEVDWTRIPADVQGVVRATVRAAAIRNESYGTARLRLVDVSAGDSVVGTSEPINAVVSMYAREQSVEFTIRGGPERGRYRLEMMGSKDTSVAVLRANLAFRATR